MSCILKISKSYISNSTASRSVIVSSSASTCDSDSESGDGIDVIYDSAPYDSSKAISTNNTDDDVVTDDDEVAAVGTENGVEIFTYPDREIVGGLKPKQFRWLSDDYPGHPSDQKVSKDAWKVTVRTASNLYWTTSKRFLQARDRGEKFEKFTHLETIKLWWSSSWWLEELLSTTTLVVGRW
jgi:hypothetical protein